VTDTIILINKARYDNSIINWHPDLGDIRFFIQDNADDLKNLNNDRYWRAKMTPEDLEMRRHPNRSSGLIPNYLEDQRTELRIRLMDALLGPGNFNPSDWSFRDKPCYRCRVSPDDRETFTKAMTDCMDSYPDGPYFSKSTFEEHAEIRDKCWNETSEKFEPSVVRSIDKMSWEKGSIPAWSNMVHGFCTTCYRQVKQEMTDLIQKNL
jgi:hypothetical protein